MNARANVVLPMPRSHLRPIIYFPQVSLSSCASEQAIDSNVSSQISL